MDIGAITAKGRIPIPEEVCQRLRLKPGDRVRVIEGANGEYIFKSSTGSEVSVESVAQSTGKAVTTEERNDAMAKGWSGQLSFEE